MPMAVSNGGTMLDLGDRRWTPKRERPPRAHAPVLTPANAVFALVSLEGPDPYSLAGGLGVRVTELGTALAHAGFETHLFFVGDWRRPGVEAGGRESLALHRWGQWISAFHPMGVYDGEEGKVSDLAASLPAHLAEHLIAPAVAARRIPIVLFEEWQTAACAVRLSDELHARGIRDRALLAWNGNAPYSFDRIDWPRLAFTTTVTAVSHHVQTAIRDHAVDALVIPNGIPPRLTEPVNGDVADEVRAALAGASVFFKMTRWEREDGWRQAFDAIARLRGRGRPAVLLARAGGPTGAGARIHAEASRRGLDVVELRDDRDIAQRLADAVRAGAGVVSFRFGVSEPLARALHAAADGVLANSVSEPFGLVGLEAMAAGGIVYTGGAGDDYPVSDRNAVMLETLDPREICDRFEDLARSPEVARGLRHAASDTARAYTWDRVLHRLLLRLGDQAIRQNVFSRAATATRVGLATAGARRTSALGGALRAGGRR